MANITKHTNIQESRKIQSEFLSDLLKKNNEYCIVDNLYEKIINEYDIFCKTRMQEKIEEQNGIIQNAKIKIQQLAVEIDTIEIDIQKKIDIKLTSEDKSNFNSINELKARIEIRNEFMQQEDATLTKLNAGVVYGNLIVKNATNEIKDIKEEYCNRYITAISSFKFSTVLANAISDNEHTLKKIFIIIKECSNEKILHNVYEKILYLFSNSNIFIKSDEKDLTAREWFIEISNLTYFQFEKTRQYFKNNDFQEGNKLKEFLKKAEEIKNISILLDS